MYGLETLFSLVRAARLYKICALSVPHASRRPLKPRLDALSGVFFFFFFFFLSQDPDFSKVP